MKINIFILTLLLSVQATGTVYWAAPNGTHDISGSSSFCQSISSSTDQQSSAPSRYGTIGAAAACAKVAGDIVNIRGNMGVYNSTDNHRIKTDVTSITPLYALASGSSESVRTIIQGAPGDQKPLLNIPGWFGMWTTSEYPEFRRDYITIRNLKIDAMGIGGDGSSEISLEGMYNTIDNVEITRWKGAAVTGFHHNADPASPNCRTFHHMVIRNSNFHHAVSNGTGLNQYAIYYNGCDALIENNEFAYTIGGGIQIYYSGPGALADRAIIRGNYIHGVQTTSIERPGGGWQCWGIVSDGKDAKITRNIVDLSSCPSGITSGAGITHGYGAGYGTVLVAHNIVVGTRSEPLQLGLFGANGSKYIVRNNILFSPYNAGNSIISYDTAAVVTKDHNACNSNSSVCGNDLVPLTNVSTCVSADFKPTSACIDKGIDIGEAFNGLAPDIGRYEVASGAKPLAPTNLKVF
jgi:hypothetical protein